MANPIKYSTGSESLSLKKGNFFFGSGDVDKGPTSSSGFYNGISPATGGYTVYIYNNQQPGSLSYFSAANDSSLISQTNALAGTSYTSATQCLTYYASQTDKVCFNIDYPPIVTNGLVVNVDGAFVPSYPTSGTSWYDISPVGNTGTLTNGPTFNTVDGGTIVFDGTDDYVVFSQVPSLTNQVTLECWYNMSGFQNQQQNRLISNADWYVLYFASSTDLRFYMQNHGGDITTSGTFVNNWRHIVATYNGATRALYVDGVLKSSSNASGNINNGNVLNIGAYQNQTIYTLNGKMGQMRIYNRGLSSSEVAQNYEATGKRYTSLSVNYLVIAGGGGPGMGGGGAGGYLEGTTTSLSTSTNYTITVGGGGPGFQSGASGIGTKGSNSVFATITSTGGGYGGNGGASSGPGGPGGSGGGGGGYSGGNGGSGNTPSTSPSQGNDGGSGNNVAPQGSGWLGGGGGGASGVGGSFVSTTSGNGGTGTTSSITGISVCRAGGGAGGGNSGSRGTASCGGGNSNTNGTINTGGGGGGRDWGVPGGSGGSGIVVLKIPDVYTANFSSGVTSSMTQSGGYKYYTVTATSTTSETVNFS